MKYPSYFWKKKNIPYHKKKKYYFLNIENILELRIVLLLIQINSVQDWTPQNSCSFHMLLSLQMVFPVSTIPLIWIFQEVMAYYALFCQENVGSNR